MVLFSYSLQSNENKQMINTKLVNENLREWICAIQKLKQSNGVGQGANLDAWSGRM